MKVDVTASLQHYLDHLLPIFDALPDRLKGTVHQLDAPCPRPYRTRLAMVAGYQDVQQLKHMNSMIYVEHGAGQTYAGDEKTATLPGYSGGGARHTGVIGYIAPSERVASRWAPKPAVAAGCPKMDRWIGSTAEIVGSVCFAWHWDAGPRLTLSPEMRSAWGHYEGDLPAIVEKWTNYGYCVFGHAHPRWRGALNGPMTEAGMTVLETDADVFTYANHLFVDNSSLGYEFALLHRPTTWLNAPWYRRDVEHGLRFWSAIPGPQIDGPDELLDGTPLDFVGSMNTAAHVMAEAYSPWSHMGRAAERAAEWITSLVDERYS